VARHLPSVTQLVDHFECEPVGPWVLASFKHGLFCEAAERTPPHERETSSPMSTGSGELLNFT